MQHRLARRDVISYSCTAFWPMLVVIECIRGFGARHAEQLVSLHVQLMTRWGGCWQPAEGRAQVVHPTIGQPWIPYELISVLHGVCRGYRLV